MRPQHIAAENAPHACADRRRDPRFNEAAAYRCGKLVAPRGGHPSSVASMRPQHIAAENVGARPAAVKRDGVLQ